MSFFIKQEWKVFQSYADINPLNLSHPKNIHHMTICKSFFKLDLKYGLNFNFLSQIPSKLQLVKKEWWLCSPGSIFSQDNFPSSRKRQIFQKITYLGLKTKFCIKVSIIFEKWSQRVSVNRRKHTDPPKFQIRTEVLVFEVQSLVY